MAEPAADSDQTRRLLEQVRAGQAGAIDRLLARHRPYLQQMVTLRLDPKLRPRLDPSDVVQEAQLVAARRLTEYLGQPAMPFRLWLRQLAYDQLLMARRRHLAAERRTVERDRPLPDRSSAQLAQQLLARGPSPSQQLDQRERARRVRQAVAHLPEADREIVLLRNFEGLSNQEVAYLLEIAPPAASKRYGRALLRLRNLLVQSGLTESQL